MQTPVILTTLYIDRFLKQFVVNCNRIVGIYSLLCGWFCSVQDRMQKKKNKKKITKKPKKNPKKQNKQTKTIQTLPQNPHFLFKIN